MSDEHPLDESLGNIHECAIALEMMGLTDWALKLAKAHGHIQTYLIDSIEPLCPESPDGNHHVAPIGSDEEWMPSKAPCYYCGDKQASLEPVDTERPKEAA